MPCSTRSRAASFIAVVMSVSIKPGSTRLTRMLRLPNSFARVRVTPMSPDLDALYAVCPVLPLDPTTLPILTIAPRRCGSMLLATALLSWIGPTRLVSSSSSSSCVLSLRSRLSFDTPAAFTSALIGPISLATCATSLAASSWPSDEKLRGASYASGSTSDPPRRPAASAARSTSLDVIATRQPSARRCWAMAKPIPRLPPVTNATGRAIVMMVKGRA